MKNYQITFEWPNGDWTWLDMKARDFHQVILLALNACPDTCRVQRIELSAAKPSGLLHSK